MADIIVVFDRAGRLFLTNHAAVRRLSRARLLECVRSARPIRDAEGHTVGGIALIRDPAGSRSGAHGNVAARAAERRRLAAELHDTIAQSLCSLVLHADLIDYETPQDLGPLRDRINSYRQMLDAVVTEFNQLARRLRPGPPQ